MSFNIGEEVICVDNGPTWLGEPCDLEKGKTYIVLSACPMCLTCGCIAVKPDLRHWSPDRFRRPQVDTDIALVCDEIKADILVRITL